MITVYYCSPSATDFSIWGAGMRQFVTKAELVEWLYKEVEEPGPVLISKIVRRD